MQARPVPGFTRELSAKGGQGEALHAGIGREETARIALAGDSGGTEKWRGKVSDGNCALYRARLANLIPEAALRRWLEFGGPEVERA